MTRVAILWHMHQPYYEDLVTQEHVLPWVRLHALKDYFGMVALLKEFPEVRVTFNLVPSLLVQVEAFAGGRAHDQYLKVGLKPAETLTGEDVVFMLRNFFHAQPERMIHVHPRYAELLELRGHAAGLPGLQAAARRFSVDDLRDLQVWQKLAWIDPIYFALDDRIHRLVERGRQFTEEDKAVLREVELEVLNAVIPAYRERQHAGQIEISTSPFYHPILPLLCEAHPSRFPHAEAPVRPAGRCGGAVDARGGVPRPAVRQTARGTVALGRIGLRRHDSDRRQRRLRMDGHRRADSGPHARSRVHAHGERGSQSAGASLCALHRHGGRGQDRLWIPRPCAVRSGRIHLRGMAVRGGRR